MAYACPLQGGSSDLILSERKHAHRRRNGRWAPEETDLLIELVRKFGKGKWKRILEEGGVKFRNRSQVCSLDTRVPGVLHLLSLLVSPHLEDTVRLCGT